MKKTTILPVLCVLLIFSCSKRPISNKENPSPRAVVSTWETLLDGSSFSNYTSFEANWNYLYPWGSDHNGTARMYGSSTDHSQIYLNGDGSLTLKATYHPDGNRSTSSPYDSIYFHSGTVYAKQQILINTTYPYWEISVDLQTPTSSGTWPAFWITGANSWPPESDIVEVKGNTSIWQNTYDGVWETKLTTVSDAATNWHHYKAVYNLIKNSNGTWSNDVECQYFIDGVITSVQTGSNFANAPFWLIIDGQMTATSQVPDALFNIRNVVIRRGQTPFDPNAWYKFVNVNSGQVAAVPSASVTQGVTLIQWPWLGGNEQQWQVAAAATNGYYVLTNRNSGQVIDVKGASTANGASIIQWPSTGGTNQQWAIAPIGGGSYTITSLNSGKVIDVSGGLKTQGDTLLQWQYHNAANQQWQIISQQ